MNKVIILGIAFSLHLLYPSNLFSQVQNAEPFQPVKVQLNTDEKTETFFTEPISGSISSRFLISYLKNNGYYSGNTSKIDKITDTQYPNDEPFQVLVNGRIINPEIHMVSSTGKYFLFSEDNNLYLYDLEKRISNQLLSGYYATRNNKSFFVNNDRELILFYYNYSRVYKGSVDAGAISVIINLSTLTQKVFETDKNWEYENYYLSNAKNINDLYIRTRKGIYSYLDLTREGQTTFTPIFNGYIAGLSNDFKYIFGGNVIGDLKSKKIIYKFNDFYTIKNIKKGVIALDYQGKQTHYYALDRVLVFGKYKNQIAEEFALIPEKDEFETPTEADKRITTAKEVVLNKYENIYAEERKQLINKIVNSYKQVSFTIDNIGTYIAEKQVFSITINGKSLDVFVPREEARDFKNAFKDAKCTGIEQLDEGGLNLNVFNIKISNPVTGSVYPFGNQIKPLYIDETTIATAETGVPVLEMQARFVEPSKNQILDGNETAFIEVDIANKGTGSARDLRFNLELPKIEGITGELAQSLTGLAVGQTKTIKFKISSTRKLPTADNLEFKLSATEWKGFNPVPVILKIQSQSFKEPKLQFMDVTVSEIAGNNNNIIENNEIIEATALIQNRGQGIAKNVKVAFQIDDKNIISMSPDALYQSIDSLNPGEDKAIKLRFSVNNEYKGADALPIGIKITETWNEYGSQNNLGLELKKANLTAKNIKIEGEYSKEVKINDISLTSDIDKNIPTNTCDATGSIKRYALIIGNENYSKYQPGLNSESNVDFAVNDATTFTKYAEQTLCIPKENIFTFTDAISSTMKREIQKLVKLIQYSEGNAEVIFYYAGHGFPDDKSNEAYLVPVDIGSSTLTEGISLKKLYTDLTEFPAKKVTVFLDACFSGGGRNAGLIAARGVKIKPKSESAKGNLVVFSASTGEQSSLPNKDKQHGMFSYYLMKKLQETKGDVTYAALAEYIKREVQLNSVLLNGKDQNPDLLISPDLAQIWEQLKLK